MCFDNSWLAASSRVQQDRNQVDSQKLVRQWGSELSLNPDSNHFWASEESDYIEDAEPEPSPHSFIAEDLPWAKRMMSSHRRESVDLINNLPDECLSHIFSFLPNANDRGSCALVCRRWLQIQGLLGWNGAAPFAIGPSATKPEAITSDAADSEKHSVPSTAGDLSRCLEGRHASDTRLLSMAIGLPSRGGLSRLVVRGDRVTAVSAISTPTRLTNLGFQAIVGASPGLLSLTLWNCPYVDDEVLRMLASRCKALRRLDIMNCPRVTDKGLSAIARGCHELLNLSVSGCPRASNAFLAAMASGSKRLVSLALSDLPLVNEYGLKLMGSSCKELKRLRLSGKIGLTDAGLRLVGEHVAGLQWLKLSDLPLLTEEGFRGLGQSKGFQSLQSVTFAGCKQLTNNALRAVVEGCSNLKSLSLSKCPAVSCCGIKDALDAAGSLESLTLHKLSNLSCARGSEEAGQVVQQQQQHEGGCKGGCCIWSGSCSRLTSLCISHCDGVDRRCLEMLGRSNASLQSLELAGLAGAEDKGVTSLVTGCGAKLSSVDLSGCSQITDKAVVAISRCCGNSMKSLSLDGCSNVTDRSLRAIASSCTALEDLDLSMCGISDRGLSALVSSLGPSLLNLSLAGCQGMTDKSLKKIMTQCQKLTGLNLKNCPGLTKEAIRSIQLSSHCLSGPSCLFVDDAL
ncbi:unnamed protein product [Closterium sp. Yama58-4]|nr:unnamed protein product [Closterium sp. Yama58-4]